LPDHEQPLHRPAGGGAGSFERGTLDRTSYARPAKLFTASQSVIRRAVAKLEQPAHRKVVTAVVELIEGGRRE